MSATVWWDLEDHLASDGTPQQQQQQQQQKQKQTQTQKQRQKRPRPQSRRMADGDSGADALPPTHAEAAHGPDQSPRRDRRGGGRKASDGRSRHRDTTGGA